MAEKDGRAPEYFSPVMMTEVSDYGKRLLYYILQKRVSARILMTIN